MGTSLSAEAAAPFADGLARATPASRGVDAAAVLAFLDDVEAQGLEMHSLMLHRQGAVVAEGWWWPYRAENPNIMHSLAKSFTATAIGFALQEGLLKLDDKVTALFPQFVPPDADEKLNRLTLEDLLTMRTGHSKETSGAIWRGIESSWIAEFFKIPLEYEPGTHFCYTSAASYMLSAILTKVSGQTLHEYLRPRLLDPLGITGETWDIGPDRINPGGNGLTAKTSDILKLGILHAQNGVWNGRQILPESWVREATRVHARDPLSGDQYGYHWVVTPQGDYIALGMFVQMTLVFPKAGAVLAITAAIDGSKKILPVIYRHFPDAFRDAPLPASQADAQLADRLLTVAAPHTLVSAASALPATISGVTWKADANPQGIKSLRFSFSAGRCILELTDIEGEHRVEMGMGDFLETRTSLPGRDLHHGYALGNARTVAGARWRDAATLELTWIFSESAFRDMLLCRFEGDTVTIDRSVNVNSGARSHPTLTARRE